MRLPSKTTTTQTDAQINSVQSILKAQGTKHKGALFGVIANGGKVSIDGFIIEVVADGSDYRTIQIYECAKGIQPKIQTWNRTKTITKKAPAKKKTTPKTEKLNIETKVQQESLF